MTVAKTMELLKNTPGAIAKKNILINSDKVFRQILYYAYNPFLVYNIKQIPWRGEGAETFESKAPVIFSVLDTLANNTGGHSMRYLLQELMLSLCPVNAEIVKAIIKKDLRVGVGANTVNAVFPNLIPSFGAMKAKLYDEKRWDPNLLCSVKIDGLRCQSIKGKLYSMNGIKLIGLDHIELRLEKYGLPETDGEVHIPGMEFNKASGLIRNYQSTPQAVLFIYDLPKINEPFSTRYEMLQEIQMKHAFSNKLLQPTTITLVKHVPIKSKKILAQQFQKSLEYGFEGLMLKDPKHTYKPGKRTYDWMKVKPVEDEDVPIVGFYEGQGKYENALGGVYVKRLNGITAKVGSGFSDDLRENIWQNQQEYLDKIIEVHYFEDTPDGDYRHARFKRFRPDK